MRELGLLSIESVLVPLTMVVNEEMIKEGEPVKKKEAEAGVLPFVLSETLPIVPAELVSKMINGEYVDMAELLKDSLEAKKRQYSS